MKKWVKDVFFSFPVQLVVLHLRSNLLLIILWVILALLVNGSLGQRFGLQFLFLDPEYLGKVNFWSFFFLGLAYGGFFMSWNLTTYLLSTHYFPFLASLSRPFTKFCLNNGLIPLFFFLYYLFLIVHFQGASEKLSAGQIFINTSSLLLGTLFLISFYALYFQFTNRDISYYQKRDELPPNLARPITPGRRNIDLDYIKLDRNRWQVRTYLTESLRPRLVRSVAHYDAKTLMNIFRQNHLNALILQLLTMVLLLLLGYLIDFPMFRIPAGASIFILMSLVNALAGAVTYWFNEWKVTVIFALLVALNYFTSFEFFNRPNQAYGLNYQGPLAEYTNERIQDVCFSDQVEQDKQHTIGILNNWKRKVAPQPGQKPRMILLSVSGGGLKAAVWTTQVIQKADSLLQGQLLDHTVLITGASGGMLGAAYLREIYLRQESGEGVTFRDPQHIENISRDLLNSIAFTIVSNDLFLPWSRFTYGGYHYYKDRGYIFEEQFNENTGFLLEKTLADYRQPEESALIPMLFLTPAIVNDSRRLVISPQGVSYMMTAPVGVERRNTVEVDAVDFGWMYARQGAEKLRFLSALRMNATYPYIMPNVHLPSTPGIEVVDAGLRDNYGILSATRFLQVFRDWIWANTSGVILIQISASEKIEQITPSDNVGIVEALFNPIGMAGKLLVVQEFEHDNSLGFMYDLLGRDYFELVRFLYHPSGENKLEASVSFHITSQEKADVLNSIYLEDNQESLRQLKQYFARPAPPVRE